MSKHVSLNTRRELTSAIAERYRAADRQSKKAILDEFVMVTGYHRKHALRTLCRKGMAEHKKPVSKRIYHAAVDEALITLWEAADRICGKRLTALLPTLIDALERHGHLQLDRDVRELLLNIDTSPINRPQRMLGFLLPERFSDRRRRKHEKELHQRTDD